MHKNITLNEVGLREGFQNLRRVYSTKLKLTVLNGLLKAGARHIQLGSFVHPEILPQMADLRKIIIACSVRCKDAGLGLGVSIGCQSEI